MNQEKIGKYITKKRKEKKLTQRRLAELLEVSDKTISNWERGKYMPDYMLLIPLCKNLDISVNELLTCQEEEKEDSAHNIINLMWANDKLSKIGYSIIVLGLCFSIFSLTFMKQILNTGFGKFSIVGLIISLYGFIIISRNYQKKKKILSIFLFILSYILIIIFFDLNAIINYNSNSMFLNNYEQNGNNVLQQTYLYDLISCNGQKFHIILHNKNNYKKLNKICKNS